MFFLRYLLFCGFFCWGQLWAQTPLLSIEELRQKPLYFQLERALDNPDKVYRLYLDQFQHDWEEASQLLPSLVNLQSVIIVGEFFEEIPEELLSFKFQLQEIIFQENPKLNLSRVCEQLQHFPYLRKLGFVQMRGLSYLPDEVFELPKELALLSQVQELDFSLTPIRTLSVSLLELKQLQSLDLSSTDLDSIPKQISQLKSLKYLNLGCHPDGRPNSIIELPNTLSKLAELRVLNLFQCDKLIEIPSSLTKLKYLEELNLGECNKLEPEATLGLVTAIPTLKKLNLSHVKIGKELPKSIAKLKMLEWLSLYNCSIQELPEELSNLGKLQYLNLRSNRVNTSDQKKWRERFDKVEF